MDTFQSPRSMANAVFAEAMKEQQAVNAAATAAAAAATASLQQEASSSATNTTTNSTNPNTTDTINPSNIATNQTGNGTANTATTDSSSTNVDAPRSNTFLPSSKRPKNNSNNNKTNIDEVDEFRARMDSIWKSAETEAELENAFKKTMDLATKQTESVIRVGLDAFHRLETLTRSHTLLQDELESKDVELQRLRAAEEKSRSSITNLIRAVEASKVEVRDASRSALAEAALRAELAVVGSKKNEALGVAEEYKRKTTLLEEELRQVKMKLLRATQEKAKMERDQRATLSLAKSINQYHGSSASSSSGDVDFYKRKVADLTGRLQGMTGLLAEKERQNDELRAQNERSVSQNRLAGLRAGKSTAGRKRPL